MTGHRCSAYLAAIGDDSHGFLPGKGGLDHPTPRFWSWLSAQLIAPGQAWRGAAPDIFTPVIHPGCNPTKTEGDRIATPTLTARHIRRKHHVADIG
jgi:hypothetical protein